MVMTVMGTVAIGPLAAAAGFNILYVPAPNAAAVSTSAAPPVTISRRNREGRSLFIPPLSEARLDSNLERYRTFVQGPCGRRQPPLNGYVESRPAERASRLDPQAAGGALVPGRARDVGGSTTRQSAFAPTGW